MKTTAAVLRAPAAPLVFEELDIAPLRPDEVLVRIVGSGICHTDLGVIAAPAEGQTPIVLGHEGSGVVEQVGAAVTDIDVGDHVVLSYNFCGACDNCADGLPMHCRSFIPMNLVGARVDGTTPFSTGGNGVLGHFFGQSSWGSYAVANDNNCVVVAKDLPLELLAPLGCGIQTGAGAVLNTLAPEPGSAIAIFGVGSVGLAALLGAVAADCGTIVAVDIAQSRLDRAGELGATHVVDSSTTDPVAAVLEATGGRGAHYSVDCIGFPQVVRAALECLQTPGVCATVGFQGMPNDITIDQGQLLFGKTLKGVIEGDAVPGEFVPRMIDLYRAGKFPFDKLVTTYPAADINAAIDDAHHGNVTKAVLTFGEAWHR